jgi:hypothetical protein
VFVKSMCTISNSSATLATLYFEYIWFIVLNMTVAWNYFSESSNVSEFSSKVSNYVFRSNLAKYFIISWKTFCSMLDSFSPMINARLKQAPYQL